jgi:hypothetical protein
MGRYVAAGCVWLGLFVCGIFAAPAMAATASISPSHLTAGKTTQVTITAPQCTDYSILVSGGILVGPANLIDSGQKAAKAATHKYQGGLDLAASAGNGGHTLSIRCGGANYGSIHVTTAHGQGGHGSHGNGNGGGFAITLQLGGTYAHSPGAADGEHVGAKFAIVAQPCRSQKGKTVAFAKHSGFYNADGVGYDAGAEFKLLGNKFSDAHGVYVSPLLHPGIVSEKLTCENQFGLVLSHFTLKIKLVRKVLTHYRSHLSPAGVFQALMPGANGIDSGGLGSFVFVSVPACRDPKALLTLSSPGLVPATIKVQNHHIGVTDFESWETKFAFRTMTAVSATGDYPEKIICGSGEIATGTLRVG